MHFICFHVQDFCISMNVGVTSICIFIRSCSYQQGKLRRSPETKGWKPVGMGNKGKIHPQCKDDNDTHRYTHVHVCLLLCSNCYIYTPWGSIYVTEHISRLAFARLWNGISTFLHNKSTVDNSKQWRRYMLNLDIHNYCTINICCCITEPTWAFPM